jgi:hypothetical protein
MLLSLNNIVGGKWTRGTIKHVDAGTTNMWNCTLASGWRWDP